MDCSASGKKKAEISQRKTVQGMVLLVPANLPHGGSVPFFQGITVCEIYIVVAQKTTTSILLSLESAIEPKPSCEGLME
jgi:hypothetical protein